MTRRSSVRASAREIYRELAKREAARVPSPEGHRPLVSLSLQQSEAAPTPDPSSLLASARGGGEKKAAPGKNLEQVANVQAGRPSQNVRAEPDLTTRIRELYEKSAVPVREIARIADVTERMIYRYVTKHDWKRRYRCLPRDQAIAAANRGRRWQVSPERADVAPSKGSGGRFIRREDIGKPFATGLKALDPAGRANALAASSRAKRLSRAAQAKAKKVVQFEAFLRAVDDNVRCLAELRKHKQRFAKERRPSALQLGIDGLLAGNVAWSLRRRQSLLPALEAIFPKGAARALHRRDLPVTPAPAQPRFDPDDFRAYGPPRRG